MPKILLSPQEQLAAATQKFSADIKKVMKKQQILFKTFQKTIDDQKIFALSHQLKKKVASRKKS